MHSANFCTDAINIAYIPSDAHGESVQLGSRSASTSDLPDGYALSTVDGVHVRRLLFSSSAAAAAAM